MNEISYELKLPWSSSQSVDRKFLFYVIPMLCLFLLFSILIPLIHVPELAREEKETLPPQLARLVLEEQEIPPPPVVEEPEPEPEPEQEPEKEPEEPTPEEPDPEPTPKPEKTPEPVKQVTEAARERAVQSGLLQFQDDLQDMREMMDVSTLTASNITRNDTDSDAVEIDRALIGARASSESGGVDTSAVSRNVSGTALSGRESTYVDSRLALPSGQGTAAVADNGASERSGPPPRSQEQVRQIMDANKSAIFAIYNRALRKDPTLEGKLTVKLIIEASGQISSASVVASQLNDAALERKLLARIRLIQFPAGNYATTTLNYSFDFLPY